MTTLFDSTVTFYGYIGLEKTNFALTEIFKGGQRKTGVIQTTSYNTIVLTAMGEVHAFQTDFRHNFPIFNSATNHLFSTGYNLQ